jgi:hypothetical protein
VARARNNAAKRTRSIMHRNPASRNWRDKGVLLASNHYRTIFGGKEKWREDQLNAVEGMGIKAEWNVKCI